MKKKSSKYYIILLCTYNLLTYNNLSIIFGTFKYFRVIQKLCISI